MGKEYKLKNWEIVTNLEYIDINEVKKILDGTEIIKDYAFIIHNKDVYTKEEELKNSENKAGTKKADHIHIAMRFVNAFTANRVAKIFDIAPNFVNKVEGSWVDMLKYLTHENRPEKFQYPESEVVSNYNWIKEKEKVKSKANDDKRKNEIINAIVSGEIRQYNYFQHITAIENDKFKRSIDNAFKYRLDKIKGGERNMECMYFFGQSGTGKTTYAKQLCEKKNYSYYVSSGSNDVLDGYQGQDVIILDDLRPSVLGLSDLLKMLDNNTSSTVKSRYYNKVLECKLIIITSVLQLDEFFKNVFSEQKEPIKQLKRRCKFYYRFTEDKIYMRYYVDALGDYSNEYEQPNPVALSFPKRELEEAELIELFKEMTLCDVEIVKSEESPTNPVVQGNVFTMKERTLSNENNMLRQHNELLMNELNKKIV